MLLITCCTQVVELQNNDNSHDKQTKKESKQKENIHNNKILFKTKAKQGNT